MEEKELIKSLVEIGSDNSGNVYAYVTGYVSLIIKSEIHTSDEKVNEIQTLIRCLDEALEEIKRIKNAKA